MTGSRRFARACARLLAAAVLLGSVAHAEAAGRPKSDVPPKIRGVAQQGQRLKAKPGSWRGTSPVGFAFRWLRCDTAGASCVAIPGATARRHDVAADDVGARLKVEVTASNTNGSRARKSAATALVVGAVITPDDPGPADLTVTIDTTSERKPISPFIYGYNLYSPGGSRPSNLTFDRRGGDRFCAYNWENNLSSSGGSDPTYFYLNDHYLSASSTPAAMATMMLVQLGDYVAGDASGAVDITNSGYLSHFKRIVLDSGIDPGVQPPAPNTGDAQVRMDEYVNYVRWHYAGVPDLFSSPTQPLLIGLDNEPDIWTSSFAILQRSAAGPAIPRTGSLAGWKTPAGDAQIGRAVTPDELIDRTIDVATMLRRVAPGATIVGPSHYGFDGMEIFHGSWPGLGVDHWFTDDFLTALADASAAAGQRLLDVYNFHWYPEAYSGGNRIAFIASPANDAAFDAIVQNPRSYWDASYVENSWITDDHLHGAIRLLPRLQEKVDAHFPGTRLAITEYYPGGGAHVAGAIAEADTLGVFGRQGLYAAALWPLTSDANMRFVHGGMKMFRAYDGVSGSFGDVGVRAVLSDVAAGSAYASVDTANDGRVVVVLINKQAVARSTAIRITHTRRLGTAEVYTLSGTNPEPQRQADVTLGLRNALSYTMPARSVTTLVLR